MDFISLSRFSLKSIHSVKLVAVYYFITWLIHLSSCDIIRQYPRLGVNHELHYYFEHLSQVLDERNYSVTIPFFQPESPVVVTTQVYIESVRDVQGDCVVDLYLRERWEDSRLRDWHGNDTTFAKLYPKLVNDQTKILWKPDSYFFKLSKPVTQETVHLTQFLWANTNGTMLSSRMFTVVIPCRLDVLLYPFDTVVCRMSISSYSYVTQELIYVWKDHEPVVFSEDNLDDLTMNYLAVYENASYAHYEMGNFSTLTVDIKFGRNMISFFVQVFAPAALIVILSWLGFYINRNSTPARASIGVTTVLTMLTLASQTNYSRIEVIIQSTTACDIYIWLCFTFVIAAMIEFAFADYFNKPRFRLQNRSVPTQQSSNHHPMTMLMMQAGEKPPPVPLATAQNASGSHNDSGSPFQNPFRRGSQSLFLPPEDQDDQNHVGNNNSFKNNISNKSSNNKENEPCSSIEREYFLRRRQLKQDRSPTSERRKRELWAKVANYVSDESRSRATNIDVISRIAFPIAFFIFNAAYWLVIVLLFRRVQKEHS